METWQDRVKQEKKDLEVKFTALDTFLDTDPFNKLGYNAKLLLRMQSQVMYKYIDILGKRLKEEEDE